MTQRDKYIQAVNRVIDFIEDNIGEELRLEVLASVSGFSVFHFHRIFQAFMDESIGCFIKRIRAEKAAILLVNAPERSITDIAMDMGYWSSQAFARAFRYRFGMSPSEYRNSHTPAFSLPLSPSFTKVSEGHGKGKSKNGNIERKNGNAKLSLSGYHVANAKFNQKGGEIKMNVDIKEMPEMTFAYIRNVGPYAENAELFGSLFGQVCKWAGPKGYLEKEGTHFLAIYHDDPKVTEEDKRRISVGITVPEGTQGSGKINIMKIPAGKYCLAHFTIDQGQYQESWDSVYCEWLPESGYEPDDRPCFEMYLNDPKTHPEGKHIVDICVPIKKAE